MILSFFYGIIAAGSALFVQLTIAEFTPNLIAGISATASTLAIAIIIAALIEEGAKLLVVRKIITLPPRALIGRAIAIGVGFTAFELGLIALTPFATTPFSAEMLLGAPIIHIISPVMIALVLRNLKQWHQIPRLTITLTIATLIHASYNLLASTSTSPTDPISLTFIATITITTILIVIGFTRKK